MIFNWNLEDGEASKDAEVKNDESEVKADDSKEEPSDTKQISDKQWTMSIKEVYDFPWTCDNISNDHYNLHLCFGQVLHWLLEGPKKRHNELL